MQGAFCFHFLPCVRVYIVFALPSPVTWERCDRAALLLDILIIAHVFALDDRQYIRQIELIFGQQVVQLAFKLEFADEARVDFNEGKLVFFLPLVSCLR